MKDILGPVVGIVVFLLLVFVVVPIDVKFRQTQDLTKETANLLDSYGIVSEVKEDLWHNKLVYDYTTEKDKRTATVTSVGKDGKLGTKDDLSVTKIDYNKSYRLGKFSGERALDIANGVIDGIKDGK